MTESDLAAFETIATKSCGEPGRVLKEAYHWLRAKLYGEGERNRHTPTGEQIRRACAIIRSAEAEVGENLRGDHKSPRLVEARHEAMKRLHGLGLSTVWIARLLDMKSHATVIAALRGLEGHENVPALTGAANEREFAAS